MAGFEMAGPDVKYSLRCKKGVDFSNLACYNVLTTKESEEHKMKEFNMEMYMSAEEIVANWTTEEFNAFMDECYLDDYLAEMEKMEG